MKKTIRNVFSIILAFLLIFTVIIPHKLFALGDNSLEFEIKNYDMVSVDKDGKSVGIKLQYWKLDEKEFSNLKRKDIEKKLFGLSNQELDEKFGKSTETETFNKETFKLDNLENGIYYFREVEDGNKPFIMIPFVYPLPFDVKDGEIFYNIDGVKKGKVDPKFTEIEYGEEYGDVKLVKKSDDGKTLKGVGFKLFSISENGEQSVPLNDAGNYSPQGQKDKVLFTDEKGEIVVSGLPVANYIFREVKELEGYSIVKKDNKFEIKANTLTELEVINKKVPGKIGGFKFLKISNDKAKTPLEGAQFKVTKKVNDKYENVLKDGKIYYVESDKNGEFQVENLPYGVYYLWETKAPKDHVQLNSYIKFEVGMDSTQKVLVVKNNKKPPIDIPKTGDMMVIALLAFSAIIFGVGYKLSKDSKKQV
ncbi:collagen binding domain-containing protein [Helcococcus kunzii]|uniref:MSCRAMM family protein n=1 Tax=Helcococcus kunzii TaxID=40091 RepID=UPI00389DEA0C